MNTSQQTSELEPAFADLVSVATRLAQRGKPPRAAAVKAALILQTNPPFDEGRFGFSKFHAFLKAAEAAGHVELRAAAVGPDVDVVPLGVEVQERGEVGGRMRTDVWDAFTRWDRGFVRFWDRATGRAHRIETDPAPSDPPSVSILRAEREKDPDRFVPIEHVPVESVVVWAREFASQQNPAMSAELLASLDNALPIRDFTAVVRRLGLVPAWHSAHLQQVQQVVNEWAASQDLEVDLSAEPPGEPIANPQRKARPVTAPTRSASAEDRLREQLHVWIDGMTLPELMSVPVPVRLLDLSK